MSNTAGAARPPHTSELSAGDLVKLMSEQLSVLVRDEVKLAQLEMTRKGKQAGAGIGMLGGGGLIACYGLGCLIACVVVAISAVTATWLAALIVGTVLLVVAAIAALLGRARLRKAAPPVPSETVESIKTDVAEVRESVRR
jgi:Putative Actinobacterial Holin-X, holin superfamily III